MKKHYKWLSTILITLILIAGNIFIINNVKTANAISVSPCIRFIRINDKPKRSPENVKKIVMKILGVKDIKNAIISFGSATYDKNPFYQIHNRKVWKVFIQGNIIQGMVGKKKETNQFINQLEIIVDDKTGAVLQISSSTPLNGRIELTTGNEVKVNGFNLKENTNISDNSFLDNLSSKSLERLKIIQNAKEIIAFPGRLIDTKHPTLKMKNKLSWVIIVGGLNSQLSSAGPPQESGKPVKKVPTASEVLILTDVKTGEPYIFLKSGKAQQETKKK